ncbi:MAG: replication initiation protein [Prevotellaceae bacterium]|nr:replication initiation protein [Prevotellaceae bacterium]
MAQKIYLFALNLLSANYKILLTSLFPLDNKYEMKILVYTREIGETNYARIKQATDQLAGSKLTWSHKERKEFKTYVPFPTIEYKQHSGVIKIHINSQLLNAYKDLVEKGYTKYKLSTILGLQKLYSRRLFEILNAHANLNNGVYIEDIEYFKDIMGCNEMYEENTHKFVTRTIKNSLDEWSKNNIPLHFEYLLHNREGGKKITHIEFHIEKLEPETTPAQGKILEVNRALKIFNELDSQQKNQLVITLSLGQYHFKSTQLDTILADQCLLGRFYEIHSKIDKNIIAPVNRTAYMAKCLGFTDASKWKS